MAEIYWPESLPSGMLAAGFSRQPQSNVVRTAMDAGPKKARRRYTARTIHYSGRQVFDATELETFEQFYSTILADGVLRFNYIDPVTMETAEFRFTGDYTVTETEGCFEVTLPLERL